MIYIEELKEEISQKEQSIIGRKLLLRGLKLEYGIGELPEISFEEYGKPYFPNHPEIHFNISHCDKAVACMLSKKPVGIDVESIKPFDQDLAEYISTDGELASILESHDPSLTFTVIWTKKESYCKLTGRGLDTRKEIQEILVNNPTVFHSSINEAKGYVITSCSNF